MSLTTSQSLAVLALRRSFRTLQTSAHIQDPNTGVLAPAPHVGVWSEGFTAVVVIVADPVAGGALVHRAAGGANRVAEVVRWILLRAVISGSSAAVLRAVVVQGGVAAGAEDGLLGAAVPAHVARVVVVTGVRIGCVLRQNDWKMIQMQQDRPCRCPHCHCEKVSTFTIVRAPFSL